MMKFTPRRAALIVAAVAFLAYLPVLDGEFLELDDPRFVRDNPHVHRLSFTQAARYFTDPSTLAAEFWSGTYRPLRTLDYAIDWAISGGRPWFFHLRSVLYHVLGALLVLALIRRLTTGRGERAAFVGALLFALHPVQTESVAWITSRADVLVLVTFLSALLFHITGRRILCVLLLAVSLLSKEVAAVFPAVALLADLHRREPLRWRWYGVYGGLVLAYAVLWYALQASGEISGVGHRAEWWGGSYGTNLLATSRSLVFYTGQLLVPVRQVLDYFVPMTGRIDLGAILGVLLFLAGGIAVWRGGSRVRLGVSWAAITLLPSMSVFYTVGTPSTERFLYLPTVGLALLCGPVLARTRLAWAVITCLFLLTFFRCRDWVDYERLMDANRAAAVTQIGHVHLAGGHLQAAEKAWRAGDRVEMRRHCEAVIRTADELLDDFRRRVGTFPAGPILPMKWDAYALLGRNDLVLPSAEDAVAIARPAERHYILGAALFRLGRHEEAATHVEQAIEAGYEELDLRPLGVKLLETAARERAAAGEYGAAEALYRRAEKLLSPR